MVDTLNDPWVALASAALAGWIYLLVLHGNFWRAGPRLDFEATPAPRAGGWPPVVAVVPARNEADVIARSLASLLSQDYPGPFSIVLVDDRSDDDTAALARRAAKDLGAAERLAVVASAPLPPEWTGKTWAASQGVGRAQDLVPDARYLWLTDADIRHDRRELRALVAKAEADGLDLASVMVLLSRQGFWDRLLIPAFVFFFQKLYPFAWVNEPGRRTAAAAGGSMLVRRSALERAGGLAAIRGAIIDDCALARNIKRGGPIWLGLTEGTRSLRRYRGLADIWAMVSRSAYTQLNRSPLLLGLTILGMALLYLVPPAAGIAGVLAQNAAAAVLGVLGWLIMAATYRPTLRLYREPIGMALLLPVAALLYCGMTLESAWRHWHGKGGGWKGRTYGAQPETAGSGPERAAGDERTT
jgi:hopene-associated glycosyltransferase HpnB